VPCLFPVLIVDFLLIFAHFPQYLPAHFFAIYDPCALHAGNCNGYKHFWTHFNFIYLLASYLLAIWFWGLGPCG